MPGMRCRRISALFSPSPHPRLQHLDEFRQVRDLLEVEPGQIPDEIRQIVLGVSMIAAKRDGPHP